MRAPWDLKITYLTICSRPHCQAAWDQRVPWAWATELPWPRVPEGWTLLGHQPICPQHRITVQP